MHVEWEKKTTASLYMFLIESVAYHFRFSTCVRCTYDSYIIILMYIWARLGICSVGFTTLQLILLFNEILINVHAKKAHAYGIYAIEITRLKSIQATNSCSSTSPAHSTVFKTNMSERKKRVEKWIWMPYNDVAYVKATLSHTTKDRR